MMIVIVIILIITHRVVGISMTTNETAASTSANSMNKSKNKKNGKGGKNGKAGQDKKSVLCKYTQLLPVNQLINYL